MGKKTCQQFVPHQTIAVEQQLSAISFRYGSFFVFPQLFSIICLRFIGCDCIGHCASMWRNSGAKEASQRSGVTLHPNPVIFFPYILTCIQIHMVNLFMPFWERQKIMPLCISMYGGQLKVVTRVKLFNIHLWHSASEHCCCQQQTN